MTNTKKQKILKITAILLAVLTILTAGIIGICYSVKNNAPTDATTELQGEPDFVYSEPKVYNMPKAMAFTAKSPAAAARCASGAAPCQSAPPGNAQSHPP